MLTETGQRFRQHLSSSYCCLSFHLWLYFLYTSIFQWNRTVLYFHLLYLKSISFFPGMFCFLTNPILRRWRPLHNSNNNDTILKHREILIFLLTAASLLRIEISAATFVDDGKQLATSKSIFSNKNIIPKVRKKSIFYLDQFLKCVSLKMFCARNDLEATWKSHWDPAIGKRS